MVRECVICCSDETEVMLERLACSHSVCAEGDCLESFFKEAIKEERSYPATCCGQLLDVDAYEGRISLAVEWDYRTKGKEYSVPPRKRRYCANLTCNQFLHPDTYENLSSVTVAKCTNCPTLTCTECKVALSVETVAGDCLTSADLRCRNEKNGRCTSCHYKLVAALIKHSCRPNEEEEKFKSTVKQKGYQECGGCGNAVELREACNHMTCDCGHEFCYVCGRPWDDQYQLCLHGCPTYGKATYDEDGYNQEGFHKDTGLNRDGQTRREVTIARREHFGDDDGAHSEDDNNTEDGIDDHHALLAQMDPDARNVFMALDPETRAETLAAMAIADQAPNLGLQADADDDSNHDGSDNTRDEEEDEDEYESQSRQSEKDFDADGARDSHDNPIGSFEYSEARASENGLNDGGGSEYDSPGNIAYTGEGNEGHESTGRNHSAGEGQEADEQDAPDDYADDQDYDDNYPEYHYPADDQRALALEDIDEMDDTQVDYGDYDFDENDDAADDEIDYGNGADADVKGDSDIDMPDSDDNPPSSEYDSKDGYATTGAFNNLPSSSNYSATTSSEDSVNHRSGMGGQWVDHGSDEEL